MASCSIARGWRWFSFVFGILVPLLVGGVFTCWIEDSFLRLNFAFILTEITCLGWFLRSGVRSPLTAKWMSAWFFVGGVYALLWSLLGLMGLTMAPYVSDRPAAALLLVISLCLSPLPCVAIYFSAAVHAWTSETVGPNANPAS